MTTNKPTSSVSETDRAWETEFGFELAFCLWAERHWPPDERPSDRQSVLVGRQLGIAERRWDTIIVESTVDQLQDRAQFGADAIGPTLRRVLKHAPATWQWYRDVVPEPPYSWRYVREAIHQGASRDIIETRKRGNRLQIKRKYRYPAWVDRLIVIENKPHLEASAARNLANQIERDVALGLADETWIATMATDRRIEPILLETIPIEAGILTFDPKTMAAQREWYPHRLEPAAYGTRIKSRASDQRSTAEVEYVDPAWKRRKRTTIAERLYERGWRSYIEGLRHDCRHCSPWEHAGGLLPHCAVYGHCQTPQQCRQGCPEYEPEPPQWRSNEWPIDGGPGLRYKQLLATRRQRQRPNNKHSSDEE